MNRIKAIESSLRCFVCGLLALIPVLGLPCVLMAFAAYRRSRLLPANDWNPARRYAVAGLVCAEFGLFVTVSIISAASMWFIMKAVREGF